MSDGWRRTERLFDLLSSSNEAEIDEGRHGSTCDGIVAKLVHKLEGQEEKVEPDGAEVQALVMTRQRAIFTRETTYCL